MLAQIVQSFRGYFYQQIPNLDLRNLLKDPKRTENFCIKLEGPNPVLLDFSKENIDEEGFKFFQEVWKDRNVENKIGALFVGQKVNFTEGKPALHTALRANKDSLIIDGVDVAKEIREVRNKVAKFAQEVRDGKRVGATGKKFSCILNIGIGGSLLGIKSAFTALSGAKELANRKDIFCMKFIANVDPADFAIETRHVDWETTLVIISSKSFTTMETTLNMNLVREALVANLQKIDPSLDADAIFNKHLLASTANHVQAAKSGIPAESCFKFWDWVGGRFSVFLFNKGIKLLWNSAIINCFRT